MIREANNNDVGQIIELGKILCENYRIDITKDYSHTYIYEQENIVGFINYDIFYERAEIVDIAVRSDMRLKKIGTVLLKKVILDCQELGVNSITLEVNCKNNGAIKFYEKAGFQKVSTRKKYYGNDDAFLMEMIL